MNGLMRRSNCVLFDDVISAGERRVGTSIPSDLAALGLMTNSNFVG
jgi:hypothetical protein